MGTRTTAVPAVEPKDCREPKSFVGLYGSLWSDFLERWNDPKITIPEAKGLLHIVADRLWWADTAPRHIGEDSRETCVRFLLHYASCPYKSDHEWQVIKKARQVLIDKVLDTTYVQNEATDDLVRDVLDYFLLDEAVGVVGGGDKRIPQHAFGGGQRKLEDFLRMINETREDPGIRRRVDRLVAILFRSKNAVKEFRRRRP